MAITNITQDGYSALLLLAAGLGVYLLNLAAYRLFLSPLAGVPGPKLAALTAWYEFYWDCPAHGHFMFKIEEMHKKYGPIVRINPWEVHISDPAFWDVFYTRSKLDKDSWYYRAFGDNGGTVGTVTWEHHRLRRGAMAKFFSVANVAKLEPKVLQRVRKLCDRVQEHRDSGAVVDISNAYRCFATDVVSAYVAPHARDFLNAPDFAATFNRVLRDFSGLMLWHRHFPVVFQIMDSIPRSLIAMIDSTGANLAVVDNQANLQREAVTVVERKGIPTDACSPSILDAIYTSPLLGPADKTVTRMFAETQALLGAGTETTGNTLSVFTYHVLSNPAILRNLKDELDDSNLTLGVDSDGYLCHNLLDNLPYLQACIKEALRVSPGVTGRLPRLSRTEVISYTSPAGQTYAFPPGTVISMSSRDAHYDAAIFPNPDSFLPERWIPTTTTIPGRQLSSTPEQLHAMERAFVPFGRGVRGCLGIELAKMELTLLTGNMFRMFDFKLYKTTERDVSVEYDFFAPFGPKDSKGVRVLAM